MVTIKFENVLVLRSNTFQKVDFWIEDGKIIDPERRFWNCKTNAQFQPDQVIDGKGARIVPGFIDLQLNGAFGYDFSNPSITVDEINKVSQLLPQFGVTAYCPTLVSLDQATYHHNLPKYRKTMDGNKRKAANILGVHLEGPFISKNCKGAHNIDNLCAPTNGIHSLYERYGPSLEHVAIVTLAPELPGALDTIKALVQLGIVVSAGHSCATIDEGIAALDVGVTMLTHLFNAMTPFHHRDPGLVGLIGNATQKPYFGLILDGEHSHRTSANIAHYAHPKGIVLVTDAMAGLGLPSGRYALGGQEVEVKANYKAVLASSNTIAGSVVTMISCIETLCKYTGCRMEEAIEAASLHPAQVLGIENRKGHLNFGADADFVLINDTFEILQTYVNGELVWSK